MKRRSSAKKNTFKLAVSVLNNLLHLQPELSDDRSTILYLVYCVVVGRYTLIKYAHDHTLKITIINY